MPRHTSARALLFFLGLCLTAALWPAPAHAQEVSVAVVVNASVTVDNLPLVELRRILLGDREFWSAGNRVTLLIRAPIAH